jgi:hypothetical protein
LDSNGAERVRARSARGWCSLTQAFADRIASIAGGAIGFDGPPASLDAGGLDRVYRTAPPADGIAVAPAPR